MAGARGLKLNALLRDEKRVQCAMQTTKLVWGFWGCRERVCCSGTLSFCWNARRKGQISISPHDSGQSNGKKNFLARCKLHLNYSPQPKASLQSTNLFLIHSRRKRPRHRQLFASESIAGPNLNGASIRCQKNTKESAAVESRSGAMEKALFRPTMSESIYVMLVGLHCQRLFSLQRSVLALQKTKHERRQFVMRVKLD